MNPQREVANHERRLAVLGYAVVRGDQYDQFVRDADTLRKARDLASPAFLGSLHRLVCGQSLPPDMEQWRGAVVATLSDLGALLTEDSG